MNGLPVAGAVSAGYIASGWLSLWQAVAVGVLSLAVLAVRCGKGCEECK